MSYEPTDRPSEVVDPVPPPPVAPSPVLPPPVPPTPPLARRLVRDPYTRLGGVASGLSHHFGVDVSLVRLAFVLFTLVSGFGLLLYILAWLIIPRADYWPPVGAPQQLRSISSREFGTGIVILAVLMALFFNGGTASQVLVPLLLVSAGIWLLIQPTAAESSPAVDATGPVDSVTDTARMPVPPGTPVPPATGWVPPGAPVPPATGWVPPGAPVPPAGGGFVPPPGTPAPDAAGGVPPGTPVPRRRRRWARVLIPLFLLLAAIPVVIIVIAVAVLASGGFEFGSGFSATYVPETVEEIPATIDHGQGELVVDLTKIDLATYDGGPVPIDIDMGMGEVRVLVPDGLSVDVDAEVTAGDINVLGNTKDGLGVDLSVPADEPDVELDIDLQFGQITVQRVAP